MINPSGRPTIRDPSRFGYTFSQHVHNMFGFNIVYFQCNGGGEFISSDSSTYFKDHGITRNMSYLHTYQQNGFVERKYRHIVEIVLSMIHGIKIPLILWTEDFHFILQISLPMMLVQNCSPYQIFHYCVPNYTDL